MRRHLRYFNNWTKSVLINQFAPANCPCVLDLACGKGGDIGKWSRKGLQYYVGIDISSGQLEDCRGRLNRLQPPIQAKLICADLGSADLLSTPALAPHEQFQAISIQFALHYLFRTEASALQFFRNIRGKLQSGGVFIGTLYISRTSRTQSRVVRSHQHCAVVRGTD